jgi:DNA mismatch repair protein MutS
MAENTEKVTSKTPGLTPMMVKYLETKEANPDCVLFYRLGDFYEMFYEDALIGSKELELTLTGKSCGLEERAPMCGVPFHAVDSYLNRMVSKGYKVAICEQVEDPKLAKGLVKREITRIVTPGTNTDVSAMDETKNNFIMCIYYGLRKIGISVADVTTGDYYLSEAENNKELFDEICRYLPSEIVANDFFYSCGLDIVDIKNRLGISMFTLEEHCFDENTTKKCIMKHFKVNSLIGMGIEEYEHGVIAAGALLQYLMDTQMISLSHFTHLYPNSAGRYMVLDAATRRNLELTETLREKQKRGSLFWVLDKTKTAMGARTLRNFIEQPLMQRVDIEYRLNAVESLTKDSVSRDELREYLNSIYDLERLLGKVSYNSINPRDMIAFRNSLEMLKPIRSVLEGFEDPLLKDILEHTDSLEDVFVKIRDCIVEEPPFTSREGGIIKDGFSEDIDYLRKAKTEGKQWLAELEEKEKERTGIKNLRIRYNKVFGYYLEVTNSFKDMVPEDYIRKQTLTNAERYTTPRLKELEDTILNAEEKLNDLEYDIFVALRDYIAERLDRIQSTAKSVALLDALCSLSYVGEQNGYAKPTFNEKGTITIKEGRHPVVEKVLKDNLFIPNDTTLDNKTNQIAIITGPNMAGKSTYMRQTALIVLMAQIGSYVPAKSASIGVVDRIFTRVGASDDLASGQSTFMVEMNEVSNILRNATKNSLLILDEIGRGTSTFDGLAIAWAVIEHIANRNLLGAKTLFATHYHLLSELEEKMDNVKNYCIAVKERGEDIVFLRKIIPGETDRSYGIEVAKLAGVPEMVIERAKEILSELSAGDIASMIQDIDVSTKEGAKTHRAIKRQDEVDAGQLSFFDSVSDAEIIKEIEDIDISTLTPLDGLNLLYKIQNKIKNRI